MQKIYMSQTPGTPRQVNQRFRPLDPLLSHKWSVYSLTVS